MNAAPELRFRFRITAVVDPGIPIEHQGDDALEFIPITGGPAQSCPT